MDPMTIRELIDELWRAVSVHDYDAALRVLHPDFVEEYPQSGERIRGLANYRAILENYPTGVGPRVDTATFQSHEATAWAMSPAYTVIQIQESANDATVVSKLHYPDGSDWVMIALVDIKVLLLYRQTSYFAQSFDAPEWRARWVETIP